MTMKSGAFYGCTINIGFTMSENCKIQFFRESHLGVSIIGCKH